MPVTITRTVWIDDDGTGKTGTPINNAEKQLLYNQIDAALAQLMPLVGNGTLQGHLYLSPDNTYDIGQSANYRPRDVFVARDAYAARNLSTGGFASIGGSVIVGAALLWTADNVGDIGTPAAQRPRDIYASRNAVIGGTLTAGATTLGAVNASSLTLSGALSVSGITATSHTFPDRLGGIYCGSELFAHNYYDLSSDTNTNCFFGIRAGNRTMSPGGGSAALATKVVGLGFECFKFNTTGGDNTAVGAWACLQNTTGNHLVAVGTHALKVNTTGSQNTAIGVNAMFDTTTGNDNTAIGYTALQHVTTGNSNVGCGENAGGNLTTGNGNTCVGTNAGFTAGANIHGNVAIGCNAGYWETAGNKLYIDNNQRTNEADGRAKALVYGVFDAAVANQSLTVNGALKVQGHLTPSAASTYNLGNPGINWSALYITAIVASGATPFNAPGVTNGSGTAAVFDASNNLIKQTSSRRYKHDIEPARLDRDTISRVLAVEPAWFQYNGPDTNDRLLGFIAEDLADSHAALVYRDAAGLADSVRDHALLAVHHTALADVYARLAALEAR